MMSSMNEYLGATVCRNMFIGVMSLNELISIAKICFRIEAENPLIRIVPVVSIVTGCCGTKTLTLQNTIVGIVSPAALYLALIEL